MTVVILILLIGLAAANGANDVSKGVATLAGAGIAAYRTAILWGAATTFVGALLSIQLGRGMGELFSTGIIDTTPTATFALAVLLGAVSWVTLASMAKLPVSTTHAIVGSLVGAGLVLTPSSVHWGGVVQKVVLPLLLSIAVAYAISLVLTFVARSLQRSVGYRGPVHTQHPVAVAVGGRQPAAQAEEAEQPLRSADPTPSIGDLALTSVHWLSSGLASCARGLNDTPKIAAVAGFALIPAGFAANLISFLVAAAMATGSLAGIRVAKMLGEKVVRMSHSEGFTANATTAGLVGAGALLALPMSTTQVSTGAIVGTAGGQLNRISGKTVRDFVIAWTATPIFAACVAAVVFAIAR